MESLKREKSKSRIVTALICAGISMAMVVGIILEPTFRERPNMVAFAIGFVSIISFFGFLFYALIYSISGAFIRYEFLPDKLIIQRIAGKNTDTSVNYVEIIKIEAKIPYIGNIPKEHYANFKILTENKTFELEAVSDWEEVLLYLVERVSNIRDIPMELLLEDKLTALIYKQAYRRKRLQP